MHERDRSRNSPQAGHFPDRRWPEADAASPDEALKLQRPPPDGSLRIVARGVKDQQSGDRAASLHQRSRASALRMFLA